MLFKAISIVAFASVVANAQAPIPAAQVRFRNSGWIDCKTIEGGGIFLPVKINGHEALAQLYGGPSNVDVKMASSLGLIADAGSASELTLELGHLKLKGFRAKDANLERPSLIAGRPTPLRLGEELFRESIVIMDFSHHRIAFRDPAKVKTLRGAAKVPLTEISDEWVAPISVSDGPPAQFELELGNVSGPLLVSPAFAKEQHLLEDKQTSERLSGPFIETVVTVTRLGFAGSTTPAAPIALIPESQIPQPSIAGGVGLPLLERFNLVIDYPHKQMYAKLRKEMTSAPFLKDRIGLVVDRQKDSSFAVTFVAPGSPASGDGFKIGDRIRLINGMTTDKLPFLDMATLRYTVSGKIVTFTMQDGSLRELTAGDFF